jgi:hypothetical protein
MAGDMATARAPRTCEVCGRVVTANNLARHVRTHDNGAAPAPAKRRRGKAAAPTGRAATVAIGAYLDEIADGGSYAAGRVALGALEGFPAMSRDPEIIDAAAAEIERRADETTSRVRELKYRQRVLELRAGAEDLRAVATGDDAESAFVEVAAAWAEANGITYEAFREMGVPARVLKAAGIARA